MADENDLLRALPLEDRLGIAAVDLVLTGAPKTLVGAVWEAAELVGSGLLEPSGQPEPSSPRTVRQLPSS